jgi:predicted RNA-binding Zn-ribbon protein involved in translation (DUF1610 family)
MNNIKNDIGYTIELSEFSTYIAIHCPSCNKKAVIKTKQNWFIVGRIVCAECGFFKDLDENSSYELCTNGGTTVGNKSVLANPRGLNLVLWYSANFKGNSFWAYNENHLQFLHDFIIAKHRARSQTELKNRSIGSRLPKWMTSSANRESLIKLIDNMV